MADRPVGRTAAGPADDLTAYHGGCHTDLGDTGRVARERVGVQNYQIGQLADLQGALEVFLHVQKSRRAGVAGHRVGHGGPLVRP